MITLYLMLSYPYHYYWQEQNVLFSDVYRLFGHFYYYQYAGPILQCVAFVVILLVIGHIPYLVLRRMRLRRCAIVVLILVFISDIYYTYLHSPFNHNYKPYQYGLSHRDFEKTLSVEMEYYFGNYHNVLQNVHNVGIQNVVISFYYYLASAHLGLLPDNLLKISPKELGTLQTIGEDTALAIINMMNDLYYSVGDMTYAERAAMMSCVFSPNNINMKMLKRLAEVNLVSGDTLAAMKYIRYLSKSSIYREWAVEHTPGHTMSERVRMDIESKRRYLNNSDTLRLGDNCRVILTELLKSNPRNEIALDYLLCTDLLLKDIELFKRDYDKYYLERGLERQKELYQQALVIYLAGTDATEEQWSKYITMPYVKKRFAEYNKCRGSQDFKETYWYYFDKE
ncbi:MAG: hypothetical protein HUJ96_01010 [Marinilabiliaceae bacterium]|nr:hypothetical protein [Marinilabiliaceae bacterium]